MCGTGRSAPNSLRFFYLMRMGFFMAHFYLYRSVMVLFEDYEYTSITNHTT